MFVLVDSTQSSTNSNIKSQSLLTPSKIFSVLNKPSVLIQGTQTTESRKHKSEQNSTELPHEKRFKSSSSDTNEDGPCSSGTVTNTSSVASSTVEENPSSETVENTSTNLPHNSLQKSGAISAFTEPIKTRTTQEKRHRTADEEQSGRGKGAPAYTDQPGPAPNMKDTDTKKSKLPSTNSSPPKTSTSNNTQQPPGSPEQPREKRFKSSDSSESLNDTGTSSNSPVMSDARRRTLLGHSKYYPLPPGYYSAARDANASRNTNASRETNAGRAANTTGASQQDCSFRIRIPLERERSSETNSSGTNDPRRYVIDWISFLICI